MSDVDAAFTGQIDADLVKKAGEAGLVQTGRYRATAEKIELREQKEFYDEAETRPNPFFGKAVANYTLRLGSVRDGKGAKAPFVALPTSRVTFMKVCAETVVSSFDSEKLTKESRNFGWLAALAGKAGITDNAGVIGWSKDNAFEISLATYEAGSKDGRSWDAGTRIVGLYALADGE